MNAIAHPLPGARDRLQIKAACTGVAVLFFENNAGKPIMSRFHALFSLGGLAGALGGGWLAGAGITPALHFAAVTLLLSATAVVLAFPPLLAPTAFDPSLRTPGEQERQTPWRRPPGALLAVGALAFCVMLGEGAMADWSAIYLRRETGASEGWAAAGYAAFSLTMAIGRLGGDALSTRLGPVLLVRISGLLACCGMGIALLSGRTPLSLLGFAAVGLGFAAVVPQAFRAAGQTPGMAAGPALATVTTMGYFGFLVGPALIGFAAEAFGLRWAMGILAGASFALILLAPQVEPRRRRQTGRQQGGPPHSASSPNQNPSNTSIAQPEQPDTVRAIR
ncbi:MAG TPA: MFS transporter [Verrucomicrobiales bacterium]|nr:MFS transporter [Verrucomicrobiales bacterium]